ncbi:MAG: GAF domain-containing sensor histidine kinase [Moorea sp. SIO2B7]|nr:GAF domain-containing sensor histidine kinase [Moorena sp. SIO2B7]
MMQLQEVDLGVRVSMSSPKNRLFCHLDGITPAVREQKRISTLTGLGLLQAETIPVFDEATQTAARFLEAPICILGLMVQEQLWIKSAVGLSRIGLMNQLAASRRIPREDSFCSYVVDSQQNLIIENTTTEPVFSHSALVQNYGIRAYLGTPLITAEGQCIGTLAVMALTPHQFTNRDVEFLALTARWCLREFERNNLLKTQQNENNQLLAQPQILNQYQSGWEFDSATGVQKAQAVPQTVLNSTSDIKLKLLDRLTQELKTPLTSVIGMASVLGRELYGPLTDKQKEYLGIIHNSGQHLISLVEEIVNLSILDDKASTLQMSPVDIEMLSQQAINCLIEVAKQQHQELRLSVEPGNRIWLLDKDKVRQSLYYLIISVLESSEEGGEIRVHVSRRSQTLNIAVWLSHPWLGDGLPQVEAFSPSIKKVLTMSLESGSQVSDSPMSDLPMGMTNHVLTSASLAKVYEATKQPNKNAPDKSSREILGLLLGCHLAEVHGGQIMVQGFPDSGYRYILKLPKFPAEE